MILVEDMVELGCLPHAIGREDGGVLVCVRNRKYGRNATDHPTFTEILG